MKIRLNLKKMKIRFKLNKIINKNNFKNNNNIFIIETKLKNLLNKLIYNFIYSKYIYILKTKFLKFDKYIRIFFEVKSIILNIYI